LIGDSRTNIEHDNCAMSSNTEEKIKQILSILTNSHLSSLQASLSLQYPKHLV
jgi:hypothetical protein